MKVVQLETTPEVRGLEHRGGTFHARTIVEGKPGTPGNFKFSLSRLGTDYSGPRHRHNFDQYRYMIEGWSDYGQDGRSRPGMLGYYPEGVHYGPQVNKTEIYCAVLQFGGASGSGYLLPREAKAGMEELKQFGEFKDGVFHRREGFPGKRNMDAFQAIWEHVHGRECTIPRAAMPRRSRLIRAFLTGCRSKRQGCVGKAVRRVDRAPHAAGLFKLAKGARFEAVGHGVYLVLSGAGACAGNPLKQYTTVYVEVNERATIEASEETLLLHYGLPDLSDIEAAGQTSGTLQAAE